MCTILAALRAVKYQRAGCRQISFSHALHDPVAAGNGIYANARRSFEGYILCVETWNTSTDFGFSIIGPLFFCMTAKKLIAEGCWLCVEVTVSNFPFSESAAPQPLLARIGPPLQSDMLKPRAVNCYPLELAFYFNKWIKFSCIYRSICNKFKFPEYTEHEMSNWRT
jgi:hypothetical protein